MKNQFRRILSIVLCALLLLAAAPATGLSAIADLLSVTAAATYYSGECGANGSNVTWSLDTETGVLTISGTGAIKSYSSPSYTPWNAYQYSIQILEIGNGITSIGD